MNQPMKQSEQVEQREKKKDERLKQGFYSKPRVLLWMLKKKKLSKAAYWLLDILLHLENQFARDDEFGGKRGKWFFCSNKDICSLGVLKIKTLRKARKELLDRGWIEFKPGRTGHASDYKIVAGFELNCD